MDQKKAEKEVQGLLERERRQVRVQAERVMRRRAIVGRYGRFLAATPYRRHREREETPAPPDGSLTTYREGITCPLCGNGQVVRRTSRAGVNYLAVAALGLELRNKTVVNAWDGISSETLGEEFC